MIQVKTTKIVVAPNAFKGSLSSSNAARAIKKGVLAASPGCEVLCVPLADGGDGLTEVMINVLAVEPVRVEVKGPIFQPLTATFAYSKKNYTAVVEMAQASGLALLAEELRDPTRTTTFGTGQLILEALNLGARRIIVGLGGSATCDGGIGMAAALGYRFFDLEGNELDPIGDSLIKIHSVDTSRVDKKISEVEFQGVCDVNNPLTGKNGASPVYSPQKGATPEQVEQLDQGLMNLARVVRRDLGINLERISGAGAAGGLGAGIYCFLGAKLEKGIDLVMDVVGLAEKLQGARLVITGEGQIDYQTKFDKAPAGVARLARKADIPCIALCGGIGERINELRDIGMTAVFSICKGPTSREKAMDDSFTLLAAAAEESVRLFLAGFE